MPGSQKPGYVMPPQGSSPSHPLDVRGAIASHNDAAWRADWTALDGISWAIRPQPDGSVLKVPSAADNSAALAQGWGAGAELHRVELRAGDCVLFDVTTLQHLSNVPVLRAGFRPSVLFCVHRLNQAGGCVRAGEGDARDPSLDRYAGEAIDLL